MRLVLSLRQMVRISLLSILAVALSAPIAHASGGGHVLPPSATPYGYSLKEMAQLVAPFTTSGNNPTYYPDTPIQVLYVDFSTVEDDPSGGGLSYTGSNVITAETGTKFYVPIWSANDSPLVAGDFPTTPEAARPYFFEQSQLGGRGFEIVVDGKSTKIGPAYLAGPVRAELLDDDGDPDTPLGTHIMTLGAFLGPLSPGTHTVTMRGGLFGDLIQSTYDIEFLQADYTYTVKVVTHRPKS